MSPLFAVRDLLRDSSAATASQLSAELRLAPAVVDEMLEYWLRRGCVRPVEVGTGGTCGGGSCGGCGGSPSCGPQVTKAWAWCGPTVRHRHEWDKLR